MNLLKFKKGKRFISLLLAVCFVSICNTSAMAATEETKDGVTVRHYTSDEKLYLKAMNESTFNTYLFNEIKKIEPSLRAKLISEVDHLDDFSVKSLNFDINTGKVDVRFYTHWRKSFHIIKDWTTHGDIAASGYLKVSSDLTQYGLVDLKVTSVNVDDLPGELDQLIQRKLNEHLQQTIWSGGSAPASAIDFNQNILRNVINKYLNKTVPYTTKILLPFKLGTATVDINGEVELEEFSITTGKAKFSASAKSFFDMKNEDDYTLDSKITVDCMLHLDTTDNTIVVEVAPTIKMDDTLTGQDASDQKYLQQTVEELWSEATNLYGKYIKLNES